MPITHAQVIGRARRQVEILCEQLRSRPDVCWQLEVLASTASIRCR
jgi:hypothetical protein